jgi:Secretion system C-terminal sorting domain
MKYFILTLFISASILSYSQSIERQLIGSTGFSVQLTTAGMDCTVGEPLIAFSSSADNILSQGFLQPDIDGVIYVEDLENTFLLLYPNPTKNNFFIKTTGAITQLEMYDAQGRLVFSTDSTIQNSVINPGDLAQGLYQVKITIDAKFYIRKIQIL